jgi:hypothetical protein
MLQTKERTPTPSFNVFTFELTFESFKEFGGASRGIRTCDPPHPLHLSFPLYLIVQDEEPPLGPLPFCGIMLNG